jgi:hypothetical protein
MCLLSSINTVKLIVPSGRWHCCDCNARKGCRRTDLLQQGGEYGRAVNPDVRRHSDDTLEK